MKPYHYGEECKIIFRKLSEDDTTLLFDFQCENESIRNFLQKESVNTNENVTYLFIDSQCNTVIGFCSICCTGISTVECDIDGNYYNTSLPAVEIDFFAIDERYRSLLYDAESSKNETLSSVLFLYMLNYISEFSKNVVGATHVCLYSVKRAFNFYKRCGFEPFDEYMKRDEDPYLDGCIPMFLSLPT